MLYKILLLAVFIGVVISLWSGFFFMMKDKGRSNRMVNALFIRVGLSALLVALIVYGYYAGELNINPTPLQ